MPSVFDRVTLSPHFRDVAHAQTFFDELTHWDVDGLIVTPLDMNRGPAPSFWHGMTGPLQSWGSSPFGTDAAPGLGAHRDAGQVRQQLDILDHVYAACLERGLQLFVSVPLLKFAVADAEAVRAELPDLFDATGSLRLTSEGLGDVITATLGEIARRYPRLSGVEARIAEGASATIHPFTAEDLAHAEDWFAPWLDRVDAFCARRGWEVIVFPHQYHARRGDRRRLHAILAEHPDDWVLEDLTWPEEHVALPYLGYLGDEWAARLARDNRLTVNFLLDTEYMGQGRIPSVLPGWWAGGLRQIAAYGARGANGRVMRWDQFGSLDTWNVFNIDVFCALARDPEADPQAVMAESLARRYGAEARPLADLLAHSERLIRAQTLNGVDPTSHSAFPPVRALAHRYFDTPLSMQAVDDLYAPAGTRCFGVADDGLTAAGEWRHQLRISSRSAAAYRAEFDELVHDVTALEREARTIAARLRPGVREFVETSYALWTVQAKALRLFVHGAEQHASWLASPSSAAGVAMGQVAEAMRSLADEVASRFAPDVLFDLAPRLRAMAAFLSDPGQGSARFGADGTEGR